MRNRRKRPPRRLVKAAPMEYLSWKESCAAERAWETPPAGLTMRIVRSPSPLAGRKNRSSVPDAKKPKGEILATAKPKGGTAARKTGAKSASKSATKDSGKTAAKSGSRTASKSASRSGTKSPATKATSTRTSARKPAAAKSSAPARAKATKAELLEYYEAMLLIRRFEERAGQLYGMGLIGGFCHLYIGQEAVVTGMQACLTDVDSVITAYRDHGHMLACGMDPAGVMAELTGREGGYSRGKGGSMHMFSLEKRFFGGHGIVGAQVPLGTGIAFAHKYNEDDGVCLTYLGDGAVNQGQVYESFNMASIWKLPVIFIIENNGYAMGTAVKRSAAKSEEMYARGAAFGIPGEQVDGMDVRAVKAAGDKAVAHCRAGKGPYILEMRTYRYRGHSMSDPAKYRTKEEVQKMRQEHDAIEQVKARLIENGHASEADLKEIDRQVRAVVSESAEFAQSDPEPDAAELWTDILVDA